MTLLKRASFFEPNFSNIPLFVQKAFAVFRNLYEGKNTIMPAGTMLEKLSKT
jgi:hypothetical protein